MADIQCKGYKQLTNIHPDTYINTVPVNCGNCQRQDIYTGRCKYEKHVVKYHGRNFYK